jgi:hypothetical protein
MAKGTTCVVLNQPRGCIWSKGSTGMLVVKYELGNAEVVRYMRKVMNGAKFSHSGEIQVWGNFVGRQGYNDKKNKSLYKAGGT